MPRNTQLSQHVVLAWLVVALSTLSAAVVAGQPAAADPFQSKALPVLEKFCIGCHAEADAKAGIVLDGFETHADAVGQGRTWIRVRDAIKEGVMPPKGKPQPSERERDALIAWIDHDYLDAEIRNPKSSPAVVLRRLNRQEYNNTMRDLLGLDLRLADLFPQDDIGFGFDNVGSVLNISPAHVEKYLDAAQFALEKAIVPPDAKDFSPAELIGLKTYPLPTRGAVQFKHSLKPGRYIADFSLVRVGIPESVPPPRLEIGFGKDSRTVEAVQVQDETVVYRYWLSVAPGDNQVKVALAPVQAAKANLERPKDVAANVSGDKRYGNETGLHVDSMVVRGPVLDAPEKLPASHRSILFCTPGFGDAERLDCARKVIGRFVERAFRRPASADEIDGVIAIWQLADARGESFERSIQVALATVLASPRFLFLVEPEIARADRPLSDFELASRLSYYLWSSMPDDELFAEARAGTLRSNIRSQVIRMLADRRSDQFVENFTGQWLQLRKLSAVTPDKDLFRGFDDRLRDAMRRETEQYFSFILRGNRSVLELLDSDYLFVDETLARHYGIEGVSGAGFRQMATADKRRGGVLTQASILTLTSNPNRTSPVKRGQWILQQILGTPPPPPPADVARLDESKEAAEATSVRERMELHRSKPECVSCHQQMDPLGFALENYDAVGRWRTVDGGSRIDPSGELLGGRKFTDIRELKTLLCGTASEKFTRCLTENMLTYSLGRGLAASDCGTVEKICRDLASNGHRMHHLVFGIVESRAFQYRGIAE
jgi:hypothetical protein